MKRTILLAVVALGLLGTGGVLAQSGYELRRAAVAVGGGAVSGGDYVAFGAASELNATPLQGGGYNLSGGLMPGAVVAPGYRAYVQLTLVGFASP